MSVRPGNLRAGRIFAICLATLVIRTANAEPPSGAPNDASQVSGEYLEHFTGMLNDGFLGTPVGLRTAEQHFLAARKLRPDDPRLEYAYGLVLLKNLKHSDGIAQFEAAAEGETPYLPASRAEIRETIRRKSYPDALDEVITLSEVIRQSHDFSEADQIETARWMGLVVGFLSGPHASEHIRDRAITTDAAIRQRLPQEFHDHYSKGQQDVRVVEGELEVEQQMAETAAQQKRQAQQKQDAARRETYRSREDELLGTKEKWDGWFADNSQELDTQLDQLGDRFDTLNRSVTSLIESIQAAQFDLQRLQTIANQRARQRPGRGNRTVLPAVGTVEAQLLARSQELNVYVNELSVTIKRRELTAQQAQRFLAQRAAAERRYRDATGSVANQVSRVQKWDDRLKAAMKQEQDNPASTRKLKSLTSRAQSFSTYDPFDLDAEQQRMLHVYDKRAE